MKSVLITFDQAYYERNHGVARPFGLSWLYIP